MAEQTARVTIAPAGPLEQIARAIRARLEIVFPPARFHHAFIPPRMTIGEWEKVLLKPPLIGVSFRDFTSRHAAGTRMLIVDPVFSVLLVTPNVSSVEARLMGDALGPGVLIMAQVAGAILHGHDFGNFGAARVVRSEMVTIEDFEAAGLGMMSIEVAFDNVKLPMSALLSGTDFQADALDTLAIDWGFGSTDAIPTGEA